MAGFDLIIKGGHIVDGTGARYFKKDIGVTRGKIAAIGRLDGPATKVIEANGLTVTPGFIDCHCHSDRTMLSFPEAESFVMQGITTCVTGNCGETLAPVNPETLPLLQRYFATAASEGFNWQWRTLAEYFDQVRQRGTSMNLAPLVGQGTVRLAVKGFTSGRASPGEMRQMKKLVDEALAGGAFGMSTGLIYAPGTFSSPEEITELAGVLTKYGAVYTSHMRDEEGNLMQSVDETIKVGEVNAIPVEISHHKVKGKANWGKVNATLREMEQARERGVEVNCDVYPYVASSTNIKAIVPTWLVEGGVVEMMKRLKDKKLRERARQEILKGEIGGSNYILAAGWGGIRISSCPANHAYEGKSLEQILRSKGVFDAPFEGFFDLLLEIEGAAGIIGFNMDEEDVKTVIAHPLACICTDGTVTAPRAGGVPHPRYYGTFPRVLGKYVREEHLISLEEAVRKMTSLPAGKFGITGRGLIKEGFYADINIIDPVTIIDKATFDAPHQYPEGIKYVLVNGEMVVANGQHTGAKPGMVLKRG
jgi:N-acyl-D-amino-acid deacylase